jgi:menaquinone-dependent protoporphyrinogen oxidase
MRILITYGSKRGGTAGIARMLADAFAELGVIADLMAPAVVDGTHDYDAVIIGGALYMNRWHRDARQFIRRHEHALRLRPVWLFSSGPLDDSASRREIPPTPQVDRMMGLVDARGHKTFGGRLTKDAKGLIARSMAKTRAGDFRDEKEIRRWARRIADELGYPVPDTSEQRNRSPYADA